MNLKSEWNDYKRKVIPADAPPVQLSECQNAFYAGALSMFNLMMDASNLPESMAANLLDQLHRELVEYGKQSGCQ